MNNPKNKSNLTQMLKLVEGLSLEDRLELRVELGNRNPPFSCPNPLAETAPRQAFDVGPAMSSKETLALLTRMMASPDSQTVDQWDELKIHLDQERLSDRKLFND
jgi:hypothetical protein